jgi:hypothetical protein
MLEPSPRTVFTVQCEISGWETYGIRCRGLGGKSVPGKLAGMKGKPLLTSKSLSANSVYHTFAFLFTQSLLMGTIRVRRTAQFPLQMRLNCR